MPEPKTKPTTQDPLYFLDSLESEQRKKDSLILLKMFEDATGEKAKMWGPSIIGFGTYIIKSEKTKQESEWPLVAFSPRKQNITLYVISENNTNNALLEKLGKYKTSKVCLYINKLDDIDLQVLSKIIENSYQSAKQTLT